MYGQKSRNKNTLLRKNEMALGEIHSKTVNERPMSLIVTRRAQHHTKGHKVNERRINK